MEERKTLLQKWQDEIAPFAIVDQTVEIHRRHLVAILARKQVQQEIDSKCLAQRKLSNAFYCCDNSNAEFRGSNRLDNERLCEELVHAQADRPADGHL